MKPLGKLSIKNKLVSIILLVSIPVLIAWFSIIVISDANDLQSDFLNRMKLKAMLVGEIVEGSPSVNNSEVVNNVLKNVKSTPDFEKIYFFIGKIELIILLRKEGLDETRVSLPLVDDYYEVKGERIHLLHPVSVRGEKNGFLYMIGSFHHIKQDFFKKIGFLFLVLLGLIALSYFAALHLQGVISQPILKLANVTAYISDHSDYSVVVKKEGEDEIGMLYDGFNNVLKQIRCYQKKRDAYQQMQQNLLNQLEEKNKELSQLVYVTSHDLRSPLVNIQGFSQELGYSVNELRDILMATDSIPEDQKAKISQIVEESIQESLRYIDASTHSMDTLLSGLLKLSRVERTTSTFEVIDMNGVIADITDASEFQIKESHAKVTVEDLPPCFGNPIQINQCFSNLLCNAIKYRDPDRPLEIKISGRIVPETKQAIYSVEDNGIGILPQNQSRIFEIFYRVNPGKTEGEGLGLAIVNKIVKRNRGRIWVESELGAGCTFFVSLPTQNEIITDIS